jgi:hypothetical protein
MSVAFNSRLANPEKDVAAILNATSQEECRQKLKAAIQLYILQKNRNLDLRTPIDSIKRLSEPVYMNNGGAEGTPEMHT